MSWPNLNKLVDWRLKAPSIARKYHPDKSPEELRRQGVAQKTLCLELRLDFADQERYNTMVGFFQQCAVYLVAQADLASDRGIKPDVAIYDDDMYLGKRDISLVPNTLQKGMDLLAALTTPEAAEEDRPSEDMLKALAELHSPITSEIENS